MHKLTWGSCENSLKMNSFSIQPGFLGRYSYLMFFNIRTMAMGLSKQIWKSKFPLRQVRTMQKVSHHHHHIQPHHHNHPHHYDITTSPHHQIPTSQHTQIHSIKSRHHHIATSPNQHLTSPHHHLIIIPASPHHNITTSPPFQR